MKSNSCTRSFQAVLFTLSLAFLVADNSHASESAAPSAPKQRGWDSWMHASARLRSYQLPKKPPPPPSAPTTAAPRRVSIKQILLVSISSFLRFIRSLVDTFLDNPLLAAATAGSRLDIDPPNVREKAPAIPEIPPWTDVELPTEPLENDLVVPNWRFESLKDAVESAKDNERIYARNGDHRKLLSECVQRILSPKSREIIFHISVWTPICYKLGTQ
jgi:hypothetical protein